MYAFNDGYVYIYNRLPVKNASHMPLILPDLATEKKFQFSEIGTWTNEYYFSKMSEVNIERRIRTLQCKSIVTGDIAEIGHMRYQVGRVWHGLNKKGIRVTELTLEKLEVDYDSQRID